MSVLLAMLLAACDNAPGVDKGSLSPEGAQSRADVVLTESNFGTTVQVRIGQTLAVRLPDGWGCCRDRLGVLQQISPQVPGPRSYVAVKSGSQTLTALWDPSSGYSCGVECNPPAPIYNGFTVVVTRPGESFDAALSQDDNGRYFLLTPGARIVIASTADQFRISDTAMLARQPADDHDSLSVLTVQRVGRATLDGPMNVLRGMRGLGSFAGNVSFLVTVLVRPAASRYDVLATDRDGGKTLHLSLGETILFRMANGYAFRPWTARGGPLMPLVDPALKASAGVTTLGFLVSPFRFGPIQFEEDPICWAQQTCSQLARTMEIDVDLTP